MTLKDMREQAGLTQSELAMLSGVNLRSLQDYEQGHKSLYSAKGETLLRLGMALGYTIEDILDGTTLDIECLPDDREARERRVSLYESLLRSRKTDIVHFPVIAGDASIDMSRIYPTKQAEVKAVVNTLRADSNVITLRLFGSSITMACHRDSDVDFAVGLKDITKAAQNSISEKIQEICDWKADIIWLNHLSPDERIYSDIMRGIVLI